ncbi:MAG TPA: YtxH domain-containing protein [Bryobacteraceae bacterium]|jgi:gas vesicle protein|nr:YtxH domain-containing protein [Bryobacteraceae bacterium]
MDKQGSFWFLAGLGCGTVVGMLYAPLPGTRTRAIAVAKAKQARRLFHRSGTQPQAGGASEQAAETAPGARRIGERIHRALEASRRPASGS